MLMINSTKGLVKKQKDAEIDELYRELKELIKKGLTEDQALEQFNYLHVITRARLLKRVRSLFDLIKQILFG